MIQILTRYGILGSYKLIASFAYTKIFYRNSRLIRLPIDVRNKSRIDFGRHLTTGFGCRIEAHPINKDIKTCISFGDNVEINDYVHIAAGQKIVIGNDVLIASKVFITDLNHGCYKGMDQDGPNSTPNSRKLSTSPVVISDNVWIGEGVCIMPGVTVGFGSIIGAHSVVTKDIPPNCIAVGSPARIIKIYDVATKQWIPNKI